MSSSSNDDRSNSLNTNNPAYWASLENHRNQVGDYDDGDEPVVAHIPLAPPPPPPATMAKSTQPDVFVARRDPREIEEQAEWAKFNRELARLIESSPI